MTATVIVTGSSGGIGRAISVECLSAGYRVIAVDQKSGDATDEVITYRGDVSSPELVNEVLNHACSSGQQVSLVNAAGVTRPEAGSYSPSSWHETIAVNLSAVYLWCEGFRQRVRSGRLNGSVIVNIGSLAAHRGFLDNPAYAASKAGVVGLTRSYAMELGAFGIRVVSISPGYIRTEMTTKSWNDPELRLRRAQSSILGRWGEPEDVARVCRFMLSPDAGFVTGIDIPVDGGWLAKG
ncbi:MAG: SDR family oxidoreductase [Actinobacteria bacterium]|nr:SDR family oxidoreductase [Actinomycetota bacterium]